jgi:hypothetical protein
MRKSFAEENAQRRKDREGHLGERNEEQLKDRMGEQQ